jgi:hypothetical protein
MNSLSAYFLILRYPALSSYIEKLFNEGEDEELMDFIFALETDDEWYLS